MSHARKFKRRLQGNAATPPRIPPDTRKTILSPASYRAWQEDIRKRGCTCGQKREVAGIPECFVHPYGKPLMETVNESLRVVTLYKGCSVGPTTVIDSMNEGLLMSMLRLGVL